MSGSPAAPKTVMSAVLLHEDPRIRQGLVRICRNLLPSAMVVAGPSLNHALALPEDHLPLDLLVMDGALCLPEALDGIRRCRHTHPRALIMVLSVPELLPEVPALMGEGVMVVDDGWQSLRLYLLLLRQTNEMPAPPPSPSPVPPETLRDAFERLTQLSRREAQVTAWVARGLSNKEVAFKLSLEPGTIRAYLSAIYRKLGVSNRTALAQLVYLAALGSSVDASILTPRRT